jgi:hypothetical protein
VGDDHPFIVLNILVPILVVVVLAMAYFLTPSRSPGAVRVPWPTWISN